MSKITKMNWYLKVDTPEIIFQKITKDEVFVINLDEYDKIGTPGQFFGCLGAENVLKEFTKFICG